MMSLITLLFECGSTCEGHDTQTQTDPEGILTGSQHCRQEVANTNMTQLLSAPNKLYTSSCCCCFLLMDVNVGSVATDNQPVPLKL